MPAVHGRGTGFVEKRPARLGRAVAGVRSWSSRRPACWRSPREKAMPTLTGDRSPLPGDRPRPAPAPVAAPVARDDPLDPPWTATAATAGLASLPVSPVQVGLAVVQLGIAPLAGFPPGDTLMVSAQPPAHLAAHQVKQATCSTPASTPPLPPSRPRPSPGSSRDARPGHMPHTGRPAGPLRQAVAVGCGRLHRTGPVWWAACVREDP